MAWRVQDRTHLLVVLDALIGLATLAADTDLQRAVELLTLAHRSASIDRRTETKAERALAELDSHLSPDCFAEA